MSFVDEQAGERMHKRHKFNRPNLARKTSPEDNLHDIMSTALAWSDPKLSYITYHEERMRKKRNDEEHTAELCDYYVGGPEMMSVNENVTENMEDMEDIDNYTDLDDLDSTTSDEVLFTDSEDE